MNIFLIEIKTIQISMSIKGRNKSSKKKKKVFRKLHYSIQLLLLLLLIQTFDTIFKSLQVLNVIKNKVVANFCCFFMVFQNLR